jgi:ligand-binding sensor domain-containing protein
MIGNRLLVSTLEDGLAVRTTAGWQQETVPQLSSVAPRQMAEFAGALYLRHGSGKVDRWDGRTWTRDVCGKLPRKQAMMIAADHSRLYVAQWGGWSEFDGKTWTHYLKLPELQGCPITVLTPDGDTLWIGTQNRGLGEFDRQTGRLRWHDERHGLPDDWITAITRVGGTLTVGTFVGGLVQWDGRAWTTAELRGENVTALATDSTGGVWVATRTGLWHQAPSGHLAQHSAQTRFLDTEIQALCAVPGGLWVGARTGLFFLTASLL